MRSLLLLAVLASSACATGSLPPLPAPTTADRSPEAEALLDRAIQARGGNPYEVFEDIAVRYEGRWGRLAPRIQPVVADSGHRRRSEERLLLQDDVDGQRHEGPKGAKLVVRRDGAAAVRFDDRKTATEDEQAAALVSDAYRLFLLGAAYVERHAALLTTPGPERRDGRTLNRVDAVIRPGFGFSAQDRVRLWFDPESDHLVRVLFTLEGFETTRGAEVDVQFSDWRAIDGILWPTSFRERIRAPVRAFAHQWNLMGLDTDRGLEPGDLDLDGWSEAAARPARPLVTAASDS